MEDSPMAAVRAKKRAMAAADRLINRELSFLDYDARVLALARDPEVPLLERVRFCSIFSSMLDEFFMVRIAGLSGQAAAGVVVRSADGRTPLQTLAEARSRVLELQAEQAEIWTDELSPALAAEGIHLSSVENLTVDELGELEGRYERDVYPVLTPLAVGPGQPFPYISGLSISLAVFARDPETEEERFARVKVPEGLPRYFAVGTEGKLVPLERVLSHFLPTLFPGMDLVERSVFRVTRDADFEVSDEADDLLEAVELELRRRRFGEVTRVEVSASMSDAMLERIQQGLHVPDELVYPIHGALDLADASELTKLDRPDLKDDAWVPVARPPLGLLHGTEQFAAIRTGPFLVHHPYDSFAASFESFLHVSASDPSVIALKSTVYRTSDDTPLVPALIEASENGKQSVCLVEIKARGDERRNIEWSRALEQAGVHVVYGLIGLKTHCKTALVVRREGSTIRRYCHVGTGNYNPKTARLYEDVGLLTASPEIGADLTDLFNSLTGYSRKVSYRNLLVAPHSVRRGIIERIEREIEAKRAGGDGRIRMKMNALVDEQVIDALYRASQAGVRVEVVVRGICALRPGAEGFSENIVVRSILGRFLEHSRVIHFNAINEFWIGSADMMHRNLDRRVEVMAQVKDPRLTEELSGVFDSAMDPATRCWELGPDGHWTALPREGEKVRDHQVSIMERHRTP
jgi:polyphosphate kinase